MKYSAEKYVVPQSIDYSKFEKCTLQGIHTVEAVFDLQFGLNLDQTIFPIVWFKFWFKFIYQYIKFLQNSCKNIIRFNLKKDYLSFNQG